MPVDAAIRGMMDVIDEHAQDMGSGAYCVLANHLKGVSAAIEHKESDAKRSLAEAIIVEQPSCIGMCAVYKYTHDAGFMQSMVRTKAIELQSYPKECRALLGGEWKAQLAMSLLEYDDDPDMLCRVRLGVMSLLVARSGFLDQVVARLDEIMVTPPMLCPHDLNAPRLEGDCGGGPRARDFLRHEPRLLRWLLGRGPLSPWPVLGTADTQPRFELRLIRRANLEGGDNCLVNAPCACARCRGVPIPTLPTRSVSLTPSEYDPTESPPTSPPAARPPTPRSSPRPIATRARTSAGPYQRA
jgi:hypothetical protein